MNENKNENTKHNEDDFKVKQFDISEFIDEKEDLKKEKNIEEIAKERQSGKDTMALIKAYKLPVILGAVFLILLAVYLIGIAPNNTRSDLFALQENPEIEEVGAEPDFANEQELQGEIETVLVEEEEKDNDIIPLNDLEEDIDEDEEIDNTYQEEEEKKDTIDKQNLLALLEDDIREDTQYFPETTLDDDYYYMLSEEDELDINDTDIESQPQTGPELFLFVFLAIVIAFGIKKINFVKK